MLSGNPVVGLINANVRDLPGVAGTHLLSISGRALLRLLAFLRFVLVSFFTLRLPVFFLLLIETPTDEALLQGLPPRISLETVHSKTALISQL